MKKLPNPLDRQRIDSIPRRKGYHCGEAFLLPTIPRREAHVELAVHWEENPPRQDERIQYWFRYEISRGLTAVAIPSEITIICRIQMLSPSVLSFLFQK